MQTWLIKRTSDGAYVTMPGAPSRHTLDLREARLFNSCDLAERSCCPGKEYVVTLESQLPNLQGLR